MAIAHLGPTLPPVTPPAALLAHPSDAVLVPRDVLNTLAEALATIVQVSGQGFGVIVDRLDLSDAILDPDAPLFDASISDGKPGNEGDAEDNGDGQDSSWTEWHTRGRLKDNPGVHDSRLLHEDDEAMGDEQDGTCAEDEEGFHTAFGSGPGCVIGDPDAEHDGREEQDGY